MLTGGDVTSHIYGIRPSDYEPSTFFFFRLSDYPGHTHTHSYSLPFSHMWLCLSLSYVQLFATPWAVARSVHGILQARILELSSNSLLQGFFPTQESNLSLLRCRWILYHLSYQGSHTYTHKTVIYPPQLRKIFMSEKPG